MIRFTDSPFEVLMQRIPGEQRQLGIEPPPENHPCHGCGNYGQPCLLPCYRQQQKHQKTKK